MDSYMAIRRLFIGHTEHGSTSMPFVEVLAPTVDLTIVEATRGDLLPNAETAPHENCL